LLGIDEVDVLTAIAAVAVVSLIVEVKVRLHGRLPADLVAIG